MKSQRHGKRLQDARETPLKLRWDERDTSGLGCCSALYRLRAFVACSHLPMC